MAEFSETRWSGTATFDGAPFAGHTAVDFSRAQVRHDVAAPHHFPAGHPIVEPADTARSDPAERWGQLVRANTGEPSPPAADPLAALSALERRVLALLAEGYSAFGIAQRLNVGGSTVERHISATRSTGQRREQ